MAAAAGMAKTGTMKAREFLFACEELAMRSLPPGLPLPERKVMWTILQLHWGNPDVHIELQPQPSRGLVELGLHFEGPLEANEAGARYLAGRADELRCALGCEWELEEWTASWRRLHRVFPFEMLTWDLMEEAGAELAKAICALQPMFAELPFGTVPAEKPARPASPGGDHWRRRHRGR